jgi:hypothetical protein
MTELDAAKVLAVADVGASPAAVRDDGHGPLTASALYEGDMVDAEGRLNLRVFVAIVLQRVKHELAEYQRQGISVDPQVVVREQMKYTNHVVEMLMQVRSQKRRAASELET